MSLKESRVVKESKPNDQWFFIIAKDNSCTGYMPGKNVGEACRRFGMKPEQCLVKRVVWTERGFEWPGQGMQERLL